MLFPACGNPECCVSTTIAGEFSFGSGKLDNNGFWEFPCTICARAMEQEHLPFEYCWPPEQVKESEIEK